MSATNHKLDFLEMGLKLTFWNLALHCLGVLRGRREEILGHDVPIPYFAHAARRTWSSALLQVPPIPEAAILML
jgi:hypothetical protein